MRHHINTIEIIYSFFSIDVVSPFIIYILMRFFYFDLVFLWLLIWGGMVVVVGHGGT